MIKRAWWLLPVLVGVVITLPSLAGGLHMEDEVQRAMVRHRPFLHSLDVNLFSFVDADEAIRGRNRGTLPWFTSDEFRISFFRPLSSLTHYLDYTLWPEVPWRMHAQSVLWYGALIVALSALYARLLPSKWVAMGASILYAIDDAHGDPVGWIANRNVLLAATFGALALLLHDRAVISSSRRKHAAAVALFVIALLCAEGAVAVLAYLGAYALCLDRRTGWIRVRSFVPYLVCFLAWLLVYRALGHGTRATACYVDPRDPLAFGRAILSNAPILLGAQFGPYSADLFIYQLPNEQQVARLLAWGIVGLVLCMFLPLCRGDRRVRMWLLGTLLAAVPASATWPADRLLPFVGIGAAPLLATFIHRTYSGLRGASLRAWVRRVPAIALSIGIVGIHVVLAPLRMPERLQWATTVARTMQLGSEGLFATTKPKIDDHYVLLNAPGMWVPIQYAVVQWMRNEAPRAVHALVATPFSAKLTRTDERTVLIHPRFGFVVGEANTVYRDTRYPMKVGQHVEVTDMDVEVTEVDSNGMPTEARFHFLWPLEDPRLRWFVWKQQRYVPMRPPRVGETIMLDAL